MLLLIMFNYITDCINRYYSLIYYAILRAKKKNGATRCITAQPV